MKSCRAAAFPPDSDTLLSSGAAIKDAIRPPKVSAGQASAREFRTRDAPRKMPPASSQNEKRPLTPKPHVRVSPPPRDLRFRGGSGTIRGWNFRVASEFDAVIASIPPKPGTGLSAGTNGFSSGDQREGRREERRRGHRPGCACRSYGSAVLAPQDPGRRTAGPGAGRRGIVRRADTGQFASRATCRPGCRRRAGQPAR